MTAALVDLSNYVAIMLEDNTCTMLAYRFFKSIQFHGSCHSNKRKLLNLQDNIINWVVSFMTDRDQFTKLEITFFYLHYNTFNRIRFGHRTYIIYHIYY